MNAPTNDMTGKRAAEQLGIFRRAATLLASSLEFEPTLANVISACLPALGDFCFFDVVAEDGVQRTARAHLDPETEAILLPSQWVRQERTDIDDAWYRMVAVNEGHLALLRQLAFRSMLTVPARYGEELIGSLSLFMAGSSASTWLMNSRSPVNWRRWPHRWSATSSCSPSKGTPRRRCASARSACDSHRCRKDRHLGLGHPVRQGDLVGPGHRSARRKCRAGTACHHQQ